MVEFSKKVIDRFRRTGMTNQQILSVKSAFSEILDVYKDQATRESFLRLLVIPLNFMITDVWQTKEEATEKAPEYVNVVMGLYESFANGIDTLDELSGYIKAYTGLDIEPICEQLKGNGVEIIG